MSFTTEVKNELCKLPLGQSCCLAAECYGFMLYANSFSIEKIKIYSDNAQVRKRVLHILKKLIGATIADDGSGNLNIEDKQVIQKLYDLFGYEYGQNSLHLNRAVIEEDCCKTAFLRGIFLASGYLSEPDKSYHFELVTTHYNVVRQVLVLLDEMELAGKYIGRRGNFVIYYKDSELIEKLLTAMGATGSAMELMLKKVEKNLRNNINRKVNCETSNLSKTADAAAIQIEAINVLMEKGLFEQLPLPLQETAALRLENPDLSLTELAELCNPPLSKPGISGRMRKILKLAKG